MLEGAFGYRPGRHPHRARQARRERIVTGQVREGYETDIQGSFPNLTQEGRRKRSARRIAAPVRTGLMGTWLTAGVREQGGGARPDAGTPQGGPRSPGLAHVYRHDVIDLWFETRAQSERRGEADRTRVGDDVGVALQERQDAENVARRLQSRRERVGLRVASEKTRLRLFGRCAQARAAAAGGKPGIVEVRGLKPGCGVDTQGTCAVLRMASENSGRTFLERTSKGRKRHRHGRRRDQPRHLATPRKGFYQSLALHRGVPKRERVTHQGEKQGRHAITRQRQRHDVFWSSRRSRSWVALPQPTVLHAGC